MKNFYAYSDAGQQNIEATTIEEAAEIAGIPDQDTINDGAFLVVRDEETMEELRFGKRN